MRTDVQAHSHSSHKIYVYLESKLKGLLVSILRWTVLNLPSQMLVWVWVYIHALDDSERHSP